MRGRVNPVGPFHADPRRTLLYALLFSVILIYTAQLYWGWWLPTFFVVWGLFWGLHLFYVWANNGLRRMGKRNEELLDQDHKKR